MKAIDEEFIAERLRIYQDTHLPLNTSDGFRRASVLILFVCMENRWHILFTRRTDAVESHKGQVSFPGGGVEPDDADPVATALRETHEEIGLSMECVKVLGCLPVLSTHSGFLITPVVGRMDWPVELVASEAEVSRIFTVPLDWLSSRENWQERDYSRADGSQEKVVFYHDYDGEIVWGITGRLTLILLTALGLN